MNGGLYSALRLQLLVGLATAATGVLTVSSGPQISRYHSTYEGVPCVARDGKPAACGYYGENYMWCYINTYDYSNGGYWDYCSEGKSCSWDMDDFTANYHMPLLLDANHRIVLPTLDGNKKIVRIESGKEVTIACSSSSSAGLQKVNRFLLFDHSAIKAKCTDDGYFSFENKKYEITALGCTNPIKPTIKEKSGSRPNCKGWNNQNGVLYEIGFETIGNNFYSQIEVCFDKKTLTTHWSKHIIKSRSMTARDKNKCERPSFKNELQILPPNVNTAWTWDSQHTTLEGILARHEQGYINNIFSIKEGWYFAKGHLAADADFVTENEQLATYYYINTLPQWQVINNGNWKKIEGIIRKQAESSSQDFTVITGGLKTLILRNDNGEKEDITFGIQLGDVDKVPIPAFTWKIVKELDVAFVTVNNPHAKNPTISPGIDPILNKLKDICNTIPWLDGETRTSLNAWEKGFTLCFTASEFIKKIVPYISSI